MRYFRELSKFNGEDIGDWVTAAKEKYFSQQELPEKTQLSCRNKVYSESNQNAYWDYNWD